MNESHTVVSDVTFGLKINVGHIDLYFHSLLILPYIWKTF